MSAEISMESIFNHLGDLLTLTEREIGIHLNCDIEVEEMAVTTFLTSGEAAIRPRAFSTTSSGRECSMSSAKDGMKSLRAGIKMNPAMTSEAIGSKIRKAGPKK